MDDLMLPPLPESVGVHQWLPTFTSEQMREYAKQAVEAEREACAKVCDHVVGDKHPDDIHSDGQWAALTLAAEIRARR